jgi:hypothetical protein
MKTSTIPYYILNITLHENDERLLRYGVDGCRDDLIEYIGDLVNELDALGENQFIMENRHLLSGPMVDDAVREGVKAIVVHVLEKRNAFVRGAQELDEGTLSALVAVVHSRFLIPVQFSQDVTHHVDEMHEVFINLISGFESFEVPDNKVIFWENDYGLLFSLGAMLATIISTSPDDVYEFPDLDGNEE